MPTLQNINGASLVQNPNAFSSGLQSGLGFGQVMRQNRLQDQQMQQQQQNQQTIDDQLQGALGGDIQSLIKIARIDPNLGNTLVTIKATGDKAAADKLARFATEQGAFAGSILNLDDMGQRQSLMTKAREYQEAGDIGMADEYLNLANMNPEQRGSELKQDVALAGLTKDQLGIFGFGGKESIDQVQSSKILPGGLVAKVMKSGSVVVEDSQGNALTGQARSNAIRDAENRGVELQGERAVARTEGGLSVQLDLKPKIEAAITTARKDASERGEKLSDFNRAKAALPALEEVVGQLKDLAPIATNTYTGRAFDAVSRELGFGASKGATSRAKFVAIVNNQILPLLKQTFGAAFTVKEAESLKATMGDPDASPAEKMAQLDAFMAQKYREVEQKEAGVASDSVNEQSVNWSDL